MTFRHRFCFESWKSWDHQIHLFALNFKNVFGIYPNVLEANEATYARIDIRADKKKIKGASGEKIGPHEYVKLGGFAAFSGRYELEFCLNYELPDKSFTLIIEPEPGEKEPLPEETDFESARIVVGGSK